VPKRSNELAPEATRVTQAVREHLLRHELQTALETIWGLVNRANQYVDYTAPFKLAKDPTQAARLDEVLYNLAETCRVLAVLLWPFLPTTATRIGGQLRLTSSPAIFEQSAWGGLSPGHTIGEIAPLFPRKDQPIHELGKQT
jgi:methionyl-tRNA synthetase